MYEKENGRPEKHRWSDIASLPSVFGGRTSEEHCRGLVVPRPSRGLTSSVLGRTVSASSDRVSRGTSRELLFNGPVDSSCASDLEIIASMDALRIVVAVEPICAFHIQPNDPLSKTEPLD